MTPDRKDRVSRPLTYPGTPGWIKISAIVIVVLALLMVILAHAGGGPRHNIPPGNANGSQPSKDRSK